MNGLGFLPYYAWNGPSWSISTEFWTYLLFLGACLAGATVYRLGAIALCIVCGGALWLLDLYHVELHTYEGPAFSAACSDSPAACSSISSIEESVSAIGRLLPGSNSLPWPVWRSSSAGSCHRHAPSGRSSSASPSSSSLLKPVPSPESQRRACCCISGQISYSIYMVHFPMLAVVNGICRAAQGMLHVPLYHQGAEGEWILSFGNVWLNDAFLVLLLGSIVGMANAQLSMDRESGPRILQQACRARPYAQERACAGDDLRKTTRCWRRRWVSCQ